MKIFRAHENSSGTCILVYRNPLSISLMSKFFLNVTLSENTE